MKKIVIILSMLIVAPLCSCGRDNKFGEAIILYTNDVHGQIDGKLSYATAGEMKKDLISKGNNVLLLDSGDFISGGYYCDYDKGRSFVKAMSMAGYDAATLGNHEFDYDFSYLKELMNEASFPFISSNFYNCDKDQKPTTRFTPLGHKIFKLKGINIGVLGISTPDSITTSTPAHFKDKDGNFIYTFLDDKLYEKAQEEIDSMRYECDLVVCMSHLGDESQSSNYTATKLAENTTGIDLILDGHTHFEVKKKVVKAKDGKEVTITQSGSKFKKIGMAKISKTRAINISLISEYAGINKQIKLLEMLVVAELDNRYSKLIAKSDIDFKRGNAKREDNMGDLIAEAYYYYYNSFSEESKIECDFAITNSGGIRSDIDKGTWSYKTCKLVLSFSNVLCLKEFDGSVIKTALEFSSYKMPQEYFGGQQQVCGIKYKVNSNITSDIKVNSSGAYVSGPSKEHEKVSEIQVFDKKQNKYVDFDINKKYKVASIGYVINDLGDGMSMFKNGKLIRLETEMVDFKGLANYISHFKKQSSSELPVIANGNSPLEEKYSNLGINYTAHNLAERITII